MARGPADDERLALHVAPRHSAERVYVRDLSRYLAVNGTEIRRWAVRNKLLRRASGGPCRHPFHYLSVAGAVRAIIYFRALQGQRHMDSIARGGQGMAKRRHERE